MRTTVCVCPFTLIIQNAVVRSEIGRTTVEKIGYTSENLHTALALTKRGSDNLVMIPMLADSIEIYLRRMVSQCATKILTPAFNDPTMIAPQTIKSLLAPTNRSCLSFVDNNNRLWLAASKYFEPIAKVTDSDELGRVLWDFYMIALAARHGGEVVINKDRLLANISIIDSKAFGFAEVRARLAKLNGLVESIHQVDEIPSLKILPAASPFAVTERIAEILEDAYLLEASHLRRQFSLAKGLVKTKRSIRKLLNHIRDNRGWAKGLVTLGSSPILSDTTGGKVTETLIEMLPVLAKRNTYPVVVSRDLATSNRREGRIKLVRSLSGEWVFDLKSSPTDD